MGLNLGNYSLPVEALVQTFAIMGIRGSGKSTTARVLAEELFTAGLPWIAVDPGKVWWGIRAGRGGEASGGLPVVVFGGRHGDLPIGKDDGRRIAEALIESNVCAVIDLSELSKTAWRRFVTDFFLALLALSPKTPRMVFLEEAAEFVPQHAKHAVTAQCKEAVERFARLGRNDGYGLTLINQRPATVDKDVLSQCENLFMMRIVQERDRKACEEWLKPKFYNDNPDMPENEIKEKVRRLVASCVSLPNGTGYFWSPNWLKDFSKIEVRDQRTFHPGETRKVGETIKGAILTDVRSFVEKVKAKLSKADAGVGNATGGRPADTATRETPGLPAERGEKRSSASLPQTVQLAPAVDYERKLAEKDAALAERYKEVTQLVEENNALRSLLSRYEAAVVRTREALRPQFDALRAFFSDFSAMNGGAGALNRAAFEPWLAKAGRAGCRRLLETLIEKRTLTRTQLGTLAGISSTSSTFRGYMAWLKKHNLITVEGDDVRLVEVPA